MSGVTTMLSSDSGAKTLSGTSGDLTTLLDSILILNIGQTETGASVFAAQTTAWTQMGAGAALFVANNATTDRAYFGGQAKFGKIIMQFATAGVGGTCTYEYWNGSAWTALVSATDGTTALTADGTLSWTIASQTGWATTAVNGTTMYWVRIKWATTYSTNPILKLGSIYGWGAPFNGTNGRVYRSQVTNGVQHYYNVNDNAPSSATDARIFGAEAVTQYNTTPNGGTGITNPFPTVAQFTNGMFIRKSAAANGTTRTWVAFIDDRTCHLAIISGDSAGFYMVHSFGEFYDFVSGGLYRSFVGCRKTEASASFGTIDAMTSRQGPNQLTTTQPTPYLARPFTGATGAIVAPQCFSLPIGTLSNAGPGIIATFNGPDGSVIMGPPHIAEATGNLRGRMRGIFDHAHVVGAFNDADTFYGQGTISTKTFRVLKSVQYVDNSGNLGNSSMIFETSDTWEQN